MLNLNERSIKQYTNQFILTFKIKLAEQGYNNPEQQAQIIEALQNALQDFVNSTKKPKSPFIGFGKYHKE